MLDTELSRLCIGSLLHSHSLAGFAFSTNNLGCALMGDIFLDQDLWQNCVS